MVVWAGAGRVSIHSDITLNTVLLPLNGPQPPTSTLNKSFTLISRRKTCLGWFYQLYVKHLLMLTPRTMTDKKRPNNSVKWKRADELATRNILWARTQQCFNVNWEREREVKSLIQMTFWSEYKHSSSESHKPSWCRRAAEDGRRWWRAAGGSKTHPPTSPSDRSPDPEHLRRYQTEACLTSASTRKISSPITYTQTEDC